MRILTTDEVREAEQQALVRPGMSQPVLNQRAGYAVVQFCIAHFKFRSVCVVCGTARSGARGLAAGASLGRIAESVSVIVLAKGTGGRHKGFLLALGSGADLDLLAGL